MSIEDEIGKLVGPSDQSAAAFATIATSFAAFYRQLRSEGLTGEQALELTAAGVEAFFTETFKKSS